MNRGFDSHLGFYEGWMDYYKHSKWTHLLNEPHIMKPSNSPCA